MIVGAPVSGITTSGVTTTGAGIGSSSSLHETINEVNKTANKYFFFHKLNFKATNLVYFSISVTPPETINFIISDDDLSIGVIYDFSTTKSCPEKA